MKKIDKKAFTLIELLVVVAVIGILVLLGMPRFIGHKDKVELTRIQHDVKVMEQEIGTVLVSNGDDVSNGDEFNSWEDNSKDLNQLAKENKLFEKEGIAEVPIGGSYKVIPEKYKYKINTKLKGTFYANKDGKVYYEHEKPLFGMPAESEEEVEKEQGYSEEEVDDLTHNCNFIPIADADELNNVRYKRIETYGKGTKWERECEGGLDKKYIQVRNVDLSGYSKEEDGWNPIGTSSASFTGIYDGGNYVITGLEIKGEDEDFQGLFGRTQGATIRNVGLIDNKVTGKDYVGGLVGNASYSMIENSYATGSVKGANRVGGLVGRTYGGTKITNSYATGEVKGIGRAGGLVGEADSSPIENSYVEGSVEGADEVGGLVGYANNSTIKDSYATGSVEGSGDYTGGLVGRPDRGTIDNSYATGSVKGANGVGGLVGGTKTVYRTDTKVTNSYATGSVTGETYVGGLVGTASFLTIEKSYAEGSVVGNEYVGGLVGRADNVLPETKWRDGTIVDGKERVVVTPGTVIIDKSYATGSVKGVDRVGGLVGMAKYRIRIYNSYATGSVTGSITGSRVYVGGLVGLAHYIIYIDNSYATGLVKGSGDRIGGLVGYTYDTTITSTYWDTVVTGQSRTYAGRGRGKTTEEMKNQATYSGWDFTNVWEITPGNYPTLR